MDVIKLTSGHALWERLIEYAQSCSWKAGPFLAGQMREGKFTDWERVFAAVSGGEIGGFCALAKTDCVPDAPYTPYIGYVFVGEPFRGKRLSEKLTGAAAAYAKEIGFNKVYLCSREIGLYEKYGFVKIGEMMDRKGKMEQIFMRAL